VYAMTATGEPSGDDDETSAAKFFDRESLPANLTPITQRILNALAAEKR